MRRTMDLRGTPSRDVEEVDPQCPEHGDLFDFVPPGNGDEPPEAEQADITDALESSHPDW